MLKKIAATALAVLLLFLASCTETKTAVSSSEESLSSETPSGFGSPKLLSVRLTVSPETGTVSEDEKFGAALLNISREEFEAIGFRLGDSCSITFQNGFTLDDVPYFNGYYVKNGSPVMVAYPGDSYLRITRNNLGLWEEAKLCEGDTVTVTLSEAGKYLAVQEALGQSYSLDRTDYPSDEAFSNFRALSGGTLKENFLFRGASPVDNSRHRAAVTDTLLAANGIRFLVDLADSEEDMAGYLASADFASPYARERYENGAVVLLDMGSAYESAGYKEKVAKGLRAALSADGPIYIHCMEGKDRTGFVCTLLEALAGASYDEMVRDYMLTYQNYFRISEEEMPEKYAAVVDLYFAPFLECLRNASGTDDYRAGAEAYLRAGGMTDGEIASLVALITK